MCKHFSVLSFSDLPPSISSKDLASFLCSDLSVFDLIYSSCWHCLTFGVKAMI